MRYLFLVLLLLLPDIALAQLDTWTTWSTEQPYVSKQVPAAAMVMRGAGTDAYYVLEVDETTGDIPVSISGGSISIDYSGATGAAVPADAAFIGGTDSGTLRGVKVDSSGELQVDVLSSALPSGAATAANQSTEITHLSTIAGAVDATGSTVPSSAMFVGGTDGTNTRALKTDTSGELQVDVLSSALPSGAATSAAQTTGNNSLATIQLGYATITTGTDTMNIALVGGRDPSNQLAPLSIDGTGYLQVDDPDGVVVSSGSVSATNFPSTVDANSGPATSSTIRVSPASRSFADSASNDYSSVNVTTGAWVQLDASWAANNNLLCITDTSGQVMELGTGAAASETRVALIAPGWSACIPLRISVNTRVAVRAVSGTASSGYIVLSGYN